jgi:nitroreductase
MLQKSASTNHPIHELLRQRWSPLAFSAKLVSNEDLCRVLEAARWAASSYNEQPWRFIVATKEHQTEFDRLLGCLAEGNQEWAKQAPALMLSVASLKFAKNGTENRHAFHDTGAAATSLAIQATDLGLYVHQMAGFDVAKARELYQIPAEFEPVAAIALGYLGDPLNLSAKLQEREAGERSRKPLTETVFTGAWGQPSAIVAS